MGMGLTENRVCMRVKELYGDGERQNTRTKIALKEESIKAASAALAWLPGPWENCSRIERGLREWL